MKNALNYLFFLIIGIAFGVAVYGSYQSHTKHYTITTEDPEKTVEYIYIEREPEIVTEYVYVEKEENFYRDLTTEDAYYYGDLAMREAEGEGTVGMLWVMYCAECRAEAYGLTPKEVWESEAFSSSWSRRGKTPNEDCLEALSLFEEGWTPKPLWFRAGNYHGFGTPLCNVGNHYYSCK